MGIVLALIGLISATLTGCENVPQDGYEGGSLTHFIVDGVELGGDRVAVDCQPGDRLIVLPPGGETFGTHNAAVYFTQAHQVTSMYFNNEGDSYVWTPDNADIAAPSMRIEGQQFIVKGTLSGEAGLITVELQGQCPAPL